MTGPAMGRPIYRHSPKVNNKAIGTLFMFYGILIVVSLLLFTAYNMNEAWRRESAWGYVSIGNIGLGIFSILLFIIVPILFFPTRFMVTSRGIQTSYSLLTRMMKGYPKFVEYRDIDTMFPQFIGMGLTTKSENKEIRFNSIVVILNDDRRIFIPWVLISGWNSKDAVKEFREFMNRMPAPFREKWSNVPILSKEEKEMVKFIEKNGDKTFITKGEKVITAFFISCIALLLLGFTPIMIFDLGFWVVIAVVVFQLGFVLPLTIFFGVKSSRLGTMKMNVKGSMAVMKSFEKLDIGSEEAIAEPTATWDGEEILKEVKKEDVEAAIKVFKNYNEAKNMLTMVAGFTLLIVGAFPLASGSEIFILYIVGGVMILGGSIILFIVLLRRPANIEKAKKDMEKIIADEVRYGKEILPHDLKMPKWFKLQRGQRPISDERMRKVERWAAKDTKRTLFISIGLTVGGVALLFLIFPCILLFDLHSGIFFVVLPVSIVTFPLGMTYMILSASAMQTLNRVVEWEQRSGGRVLNDDLRTRWEKWDKWRKEQGQVQ